MGAWKTSFTSVTTTEYYFTLSNTKMPISQCLLKFTSPYYIHWDLVFSKGFGFPFILFSFINLLKVCLLWKIWCHQKNPHKSILSFLIILYMLYLLMKETQGIMFSFFPVLILCTYYEGIVWSFAPVRYAPLINGP